MKLVPLIFIIVAVTSRLMPHPDNFAPIAALAIFSGVYLPKKYALIIPLVAMLVSDYFVGFYEPMVMVFVYGSFLIAGLIGWWLRSHKNVVTVLGSALMASVLFYLTTNFAVWLLPNSSYTKDLAGLLNSYIAAIPFFKNTLMGDLFYSVVLFGGYEMVTRIVKRFASRDLTNILVDTKAT